MDRRSWLTWIILCAAGCAGSGDEAGFGGAGDDSSGDADADTDGDSDADGDTDTGTGTVPPEVEDEADFRAPQSGRRFVYVANEARDTVAVIDSETLSIDIVSVGDSPFVLAAVPGQEAALVLYRTLPEVGILRTDDVSGETSFERLDVQPGSNRIEVAPDGRHALAFFDPDRETDPRAPEGSYQDVTVIGLSEPRSVRLTVAFRPMNVIFAAGGAQAYIVTEDALHRLLLDDVREPGIAAVVDIGEAPADPTLREIVVTPDGDHVLVRDPDVTTIGVIDVDAQARADVPMSSVPTDVDVSADGSEAIVVLRDESTIALLPLPEILNDPWTFRTVSIPGEFFGQAVRADDGDRVILFTTALDQESLVVLELDTEDWLPVRLRKSIRTVGVAPGGEAAIVIHDRIEEDPFEFADLEERQDRQFGYSLVRLDDGFSRLEITELVNPEPFLMYEDGTHAFVALRDDASGLRQIDAIDLAAFQIDTVGVPSPPTAIGAVPDTNQAFVAQDHESGRITFIDVESHDTQTVTGFELGAEVVK